MDESRLQSIRTKKNPTRHPFGTTLSIPRHLRDGDMNPDPIQLKKTNNFEQLSCNYSSAAHDPPTSKPQRFQFDSAQRRRRE